MAESEPRPGDVPELPSEDISGAGLHNLLRANPAVLERFGTVDRFTEFLRALAVQKKGVFLITRANVDKIKATEGKKIKRETYLLFERRAYLIQWVYFLENDQCFIAEPSEPPFVLPVEGTMYSKAFRDRMMKKREGLVPASNAALIRKSMERLTFSSDQEFHAFLDNCEVRVHPTIGVGMRPGEGTMGCAIVGNALWVWVPMFTGNAPEQRQCALTRVLSNVHGTDLMMTIGHDDRLTPEQKVRVENFLWAHGFIGRPTGLQLEIAKTANELQRIADEERLGTQPLVPPKPTEQLGTDAVLRRVSGMVFETIDDLAAILVRGGVALTEQNLSATAKNAEAAVVVSGYVMGLVPHPTARICAPVPLDVDVPEQFLQMVQMDVFRSTEARVMLQQAGMVLPHSIPWKDIASGGKIALRRIVGEVNVGSVVSGNVPPEGSLHLNMDIPTLRISQVQVIIKKSGGKIWFATEHSVYEILPASDIPPVPGWLQKTFAGVGKYFTRSYWRGKGKKGKK